MNTFNYTYRNKTYKSVYAAYTAAPEPKFRYNTVVRRFYDKQMSLDEAIHGNKKPADLNTVSKPKLPVATVSTRSRKTHGRKIKVDGVTYNSLAEAARSLGLSYGNLRKKIYTMKMSPLKAIRHSLKNKPKDAPAPITSTIAIKRAGRPRRQITINGQTYDGITEAAKAFGINRLTAMKRLYSFGWTVEKAFTTPSRSYA